MLKVICVECGRRGWVLILFQFILSFKWWFFGGDYWECKECRKKGDEL